MTIVSTTSISERKNQLNDKWLLLIGIPIVSITMPAIFGAYHHPIIRWQTLIEVGFGFVSSTPIWLGCRAIVFYLWNKYPWHTKPFKHLIIEIIGLTLYTLIAGFIIHLITNAIFKNPFSYEVTTVSVALSIAVTFFITSIHEGLFFFNRWSETRITSEKLEKENIQSQYEVLKNQINPHFLFNNLNTLIGLIEENPQSAVDYVQTVAGFYREIINLRNKDVISLSEEISMVKSYLSLVEKRYGTNLQVEITLADNLMETYIAPLTMQMLVENAIKHNIISRDKPLTIEVFNSAFNFLAVRNNLQPRENDEPSSKFGLQNIARRYSFLSEKKVEIIETKTSFMVLIPILQKA